MSAAADEHLGAPDDRLGLLATVAIVVRGIVGTGIFTVPGTVLGAALVVTSLVFAASTFTWIGLGLALAVVVVAVAGLTLHELKTERVVHSIELRERPAREREPIAA